ncbi:MAG: hypothetical protein ACPGD5_11255, partial [Salibacteraceae bacterium]
TDFTTLNFKKPHIWSSATLYTPKTIEIRKQLFEKWVQKKNLTKKDMLDFHNFKGNSNKYNNIIMERTGSLQTVSISQITTLKDSMMFSHKNLLNNQSKDVRILLATTVNNHLIF